MAVCGPPGGPARCLLQLAVPVALCPGRRSLQTAVSLNIVYFFYIGILCCRFM